MGKLKPFTVKMNDTTRQKLQEKANLNTNGNVSRWLLLAGLNFELKKKGTAK